MNLGKYRMLGHLYGFVVCSVVTVLAIRYYWLSHDKSIPGILFMALNQVAHYVPAVYLSIGIERHILKYIKIFYFIVQLRGYVPILLIFLFVFIGGYDIMNAGWHHRGTMLAILYLFIYTFAFSASIAFELAVLRHVKWYIESQLHPNQEGMPTFDPERLRFVPPVWELQL